MLVCFFLYLPVWLILFIYYLFELTSHVKIHLCYCILYIYFFLPYYNFHLLIDFVFVIVYLFLYPQGMFSHFTADDCDNIFDNGSCLSLGSHTFNDLHLPQAGCFSTLYMNSRSPCRHDIQDYLSTLEFPFSIYGFTETRFRGSSPPYITMPDHTLVHTSRSKEVGGEWLYLSRTP